MARGFSRIGPVNADQVRADSLTGENRCNRVIRGGRAKARSWARCSLFPQLFKSCGCGRQAALRFIRVQFFPWAHISVISVSSVVNPSYARIACPRHRTHDSRKRKNLRLVRWRRCGPPPNRRAPHRRGRAKSRDSAFVSWDPYGGIRKAKRRSQGPGDRSQELDQHPVPDMLSPVSRHLSPGPPLQPHLSLLPFTPPPIL